MAQIGDEFSAGGYKYSISSVASSSIPGQVICLGFAQGTTKESVEIPDQVAKDGRYYNVIQISDNAFEGKTVIKYLYIGKFVNRIANYAFYGCSNIQSITFSESLTSIGFYAFYNCSKLTSLVIPNTVNTIGEGAFSGCSQLQSITLPFVGNKKATASASASTLFGFIFGTSSYSGGTSTYQYYSSSSYKTYYIPSSLKNVTITGGNILYGAFCNCNKITNLTIPDSITSIGSYAFENCKSLTSITIPDSVISIGQAAFEYCTGLTSIIIPDGVESIGSSVFEGCAELMDIVIPDSVTEIGDYAFLNCKSLTNITVPDSVTSIGSSAFSGCSGLTSITLPFVGGSKTATNASESTLFGYIFGTSSYTDGVATKQYYTSYYFKTYYIPASLKSVTITGGNILHGAFYYCSGLTSITIGNSVTSIGEKAFCYCTKLTSVTIPDSITSIGAQTFYGCYDLPSVIIPDSVTYLGDYAFYDCKSFTSITIPDSVTSIGYQTFAYCKSLTSVTIGNGVISIGSSAFYGCESLTGVYITDMSSWCRISFSSSDTNPLYYAGNLYLDGELVTNLVIPEDITSIGFCTFYKCKSLQNVIIHNNVTDIDNSAFYYCTGLTSVTIGNGVTSINYYAFSKCSNLKEIHFNATAMNDLSEYNNVFSYAGQNGGAKVIIGKNVTKIPAYLFCPYSNFSDSPKIVSVEFEEGSVCESIGNYAFARCDSLKSVTIPDSVTNIGTDAFAYLLNLTQINFEAEKMDDLSAGVFDGTGRDKGGITLTIGEKVTKIPAYLFYSESDTLKISEIKFNNKCESIGNYSFSHNHYITNITMPVSVTSIGEGAFKGCTQLQTVVARGVQTLGQSAFYNTALSEINIIDGVSTIPEVKTIPKEAFKYTKLRTIRIPSSVTSIRESAFSDSSQLQTVYLEDNITYIDKTTFDRTALDKNSTEGVLYVGNYLIKADLSLAGSYTIKDGTVYIAGKAFEGCENITDIIITDEVASLGEETFAGCKGLQKLTIGNGVTNIGDKAFCDCTSLDEINLGSGVELINSDAFSGCSTQKKINIANIAQWLNIKFANEYANPMASGGGELYINDTGLLSKLEISNTIIKPYVFYNCKSLESVVFSNGLTEIGGCAFYNCPRLVSLQFGQIVEEDKLTISDNAFNRSININTIGCYDTKEVWDNNVIVGEGNEPLRPGSVSYFYGLQGESVPDYLTYTGTTVTGLQDGKNPTCIVIPSTLNGTEITAIATGAFRGNEIIQKIVIPNSIMSIGEASLAGCINLENVTFNNTDSSSLVIGKDAFADTNIKSVYIKSIKGWCNQSETSVEQNYKSSPFQSGATLYLEDTAIETLEIPQELQILKPYIFYGCSSIQNIVIPNNIQSIGTSAFANCLNLKQIYYNASNASVARDWLENAGSESGGFYIEIGSEVSVLPNYLLSSSNMTAIKLINNNQYDSLGIQNFQDCSLLRSVYIENLEQWLKLAFDKKEDNPLYYAKNLYINEELVVNLVIPSSIKTIPEYSFGGCSLVSLAFAGEIDSIEKQAFYGCNNLQNVVVQHSVGTIGEQAFGNCQSVKSIEFTKQIGNIGTNAFGDNPSLISIVLPEKIETISSPILVNCPKLQTISIPCINSEPFYKLFCDTTLPASNLTTINILGGNIPSEAFSFLSNITTIILSEGVQRINNRAFYGCSKLQKITIPDSVGYIGNGAFASCGALIEITLPQIYSSDGDENQYHFGRLFGEEEYINSIGVKSGFSNPKTFYLPAGLAKVTFTKQTEVPAYAFYDCANIIEINLLKTCEKIYDYAFAKSGIKKFIIPDSCQYIGTSAFEGCLKLSEIIPNRNLDSIADYAFADCSNIKKLDIPKSVTSIGMGALYGCSKLEKLSIPFIGLNKDDESNPFGYIFGINNENELYDKSNSYSIPKSLTSVTVGVNTIIDDAFNGCQNIVNISIYPIDTDREIVLGNRAFYNCRMLSTFTFDEGIVSIGQGAFENCISLQKVYIPSKVKSIETRAFIGSGIIRLNTNNVENIGARAFYNCSGLTEIVFSDKIKSVSAYAFAECPNIKEASFGHSVTLTSTAFQNCTALRKVYITDPTVVGKAFEGCNNIDFYTTGQYISPEQLGATNSKVYYIKKLWDTDFLGFSFDGVHSLYDLNVVATINDRLDAKLTAQKQDTTFEIPGGDGLYYFDSKDRQKVFTVDFAFDSLTESELRKWRRFCANKEIGDLIFDEQPYKAYSAKITGTPSLKYIAFNAPDGSRVYKGEGSIEFTCYWPYAHTINKDTSIFNCFEGATGKLTPWFNTKKLSAYPEEIYPTKHQWSVASGLSDSTETCIGENPGDLPTPFILTKSGYINAGETYTIGDVSITITNDQPNGVTWNSKTGIVSTLTNEGKEIPIPYSGYSIGTIPVGGLFPEEMELHGATLEYDYWYY